MKRDCWTGDQKVEPLKRTKANKPEQNNPRFVMQYSDVAQRLCPHCHRYVFPIRAFFIPRMWGVTVVLTCKKCGKTAFSTKRSMLLVELLPFVVMVAIGVLLGVFVTDSHSELQLYVVAPVVYVVMRAYAIKLFARVQTADPDTGPDMLVPAELTVGENTISSVMKRVSDGESALLFGFGEDEWLWLLHLNHSYYIQLSLYPGPLEKLRSRFESAAKELAIAVEKNFRGRKHLLACQLGPDPQVAGKTAWAIFIDTMGLERDANVSMKWL